MSGLQRGRVWLPAGVRNRRQGALHYRVQFAWERLACRGPDSSEVILQLMWPFVRRSASRPHNWAVPRTALQQPVGAAWVQRQLTLHSRVPLLCSAGVAGQFWSPNAARCDLQHAVPPDVPGWVSRAPERIGAGNR